MTVLETAVRYARKGLAVVPIEPGTKHPPLSLGGWQNLRLGEADLSSYFVDGVGIGVLTGSPSGGVCDVDLDCEEAVALAPRLLPPTPLWAGRDTRPRSHALFRCNPVPRPMKLVAPDGKCLVELRADGQQTVVYPSVHPEGDRYRWWGTGQEPAVVSGGNLEAAVRKLGAAVLLARAWPSRAGTRHDLANALAGALAHRGWDEDAVEELVRAVAETARDEEAAARGRTARATVRKLKSGGKVTGGLRLAGILGEPVVEKVTEWLGLRRTSLAVLSSPSGAMDAGESRRWPEPMGPAALHGVVGDFVRLVSPHTEADPAGLLVQFLAAYGNVVGRGPYFRVEADRHHANLFVSLVGATSKGRKGTSWGQVLRPLAVLDEPWAANRKQGGLSSGEGLIWAVRDPITTRMFNRKGGRVVGHQDVESDPGVADKRLLVFESEFAGVLSVLRREGSTLSATIRQAWDAGDLAVLTKNAPAKASGAHISVVTHITADELRRHLDRTELGNGFANRFLWICVRRARLLPEGGNLEGVDAAPVREAIRASFEFARALSDRRLRFDSAAQELWNSVYPELSEARPGLLGAVVSRAEAQVMRIALTYALLDSSLTIGLVHLRAAREVWRYAEESAEYIFGEALGDPIADELLRALRVAARDGMSRTEITNYFGRNRSASEIGRGLAALAELDLAYFEMEKTEGRSAERWFATARYETNEGDEQASSLNPEAVGEARDDSFLSFGNHQAEGAPTKTDPDMDRQADKPGPPYYGLRPEEWEVVSRSEEPHAHG